MNKTLEELEQELYHSNFRIRKYKQRNEFDAAEREEIERHYIIRQIDEHEVERILINKL